MNRLTRQSSIDWSLRRFVPLTEIELTALVSEWKALVSSILLEPMVQLVLLAAGLQGLVGCGANFYHDHSYLAFVLPGLMMLQALRGFSRTMYRTVLDRQWGMLTIKRLAGAGGAGYALSKIAAPALILLAQMMVLVVLATVMGVRLSLIALAAGVIIAIAAVVFWAALAIIITAFVHDYVVRDMVVTWMMLPLSLAAPVFYKLDTAPAYLQWIATFNPLAWQVTALRSVLLDGEFTTVGVVLVLASSIAVAGAIASVSRGDALQSEGGR